MKSKYGFFYAIIGEIYNQVAHHLTHQKKQKKVHYLNWKMQLSYT